MNQFLKSRNLLKESGVITLTSHIPFNVVQIYDFDPLIRTIFTELWPSLSAREKLEPVSINASAG